MSKDKGGSALLEAPVRDDTVRTPAAALGVAPDAVGVQEKMRLVHIPLEQIAESPLNTRKRFNEATLAELAESLRSEGQLTPALVRPHASGHGIYELAAGHRRYRAAKLAGLPTLAAMVRPMDDETFLKVLTIENLQREDVHPLEEADGYAELIEVLRYDVAKIAASVGKSERYIYDRLKLRTLAPEVRELFFAGRIELAHAIELTRIPQEAQRLAIDPHKGGLWAVDHGAEFSLFEDDDEDLDDEFDDDEDVEKPRAPTPTQLEHRKPSSVRELKKWIHEHVRLDPTAEHLTMDLPETVQELRAAATEAVKVVEITELNHVHPDARGEGRVLGPRSWKCADPKRDAKACEHAVVGVVVLGPSQGAAFKVCTAKQKCRTHWAAEIKQSAQRAQESVVGGAAKAPREQPWEKAERERKERDEAFDAIIDDVLADLAAAVKKAPTKPGGPLDAILLEDYRLKEASKHLGRGKTAADLARFAAWCTVFREADYTDTAVRFGKMLGVHVEKMITAKVAERRAEAKAAEKTAAAPKDATPQPLATKKKAAKKSATKAAKKKAKR